MTPPASLIGTGLYPLQRAARLVGTPARTAKRWTLGYQRKHRDGQSASLPLWPLKYAGDEALGGEAVLSFNDLLELRTVARFVEEGVSLKVIRATIEVAREYLGDYPLQSRKFVSDGRKIFLEAVERVGDDPKLLDVRRRQFALEAVIRPSLLDGIEYDDDAQAVRWFPVSNKRVIVLDPQVQFGEPVIAESGVPTNTLASAYAAESKDVLRVARLFKVTASDVKAAVSFEQRLAA